MADFLTIDVTGLQALRADLARIQGRLAKPRDLLETLAGVLEQNIEARFDRKVDPQGLPWAPHAASTRAKYQAQDTQRRGPRAGQVVSRGTLLERTGQMRKSLASNVVGDDTVEIGMSRLTDGGAWSIPLLHETGTARMPRRGIFLADPDAGTLGRQDLASLDDALGDFLDDVLGDR